MTTHVPTQDLVGPPCPLSNLRPVYYAPLFPTLAEGAARSTSSRPHPYSLSEFPTLDHPKKRKLAALQKELNAQDLEWRLARTRHDAFNQDFWTRMNADFLRGREAYIRDAKMAGLFSSSGRGDAIDLSPFYRAHLKETKQRYARYNRALWKGQIALLWPAVKAEIRKFRWKWALWRAGET